MKKIRFLFLVAVLLLFAVMLPIAFFGEPSFDHRCHKYIQNEIIPKTGMRNDVLSDDDISDVDMLTMNPDGYEPQKGLVFSLVEDLTGDGVPEIITGEETECDDFFGDENNKNSAILIRAYGKSNDEIVFLDEMEIKQLLPLFSFVDITFKDKTLFVSGIGAWAGDPPFNDHYVIKLEDGKLVQEKLSTMDMFITSSPDNLSEEEKDKVYSTLKQLQDYGFNYDDIYDLAGGYDPSAKRLAVYSLFGEDGRSSEHFEGRAIPKKGFHRYGTGKKMIYY